MRWCNAAQPPAGGSNRATSSRRLPKRSQARLASRASGPVCTWHMRWAVSVCQYQSDDSSARACHSCSACTRSVMSVAAPAMCSALPSASRTATQPRSCNQTQWPARCRMRTCWSKWGDLPCRCSSSARSECSTSLACTLARQAVAVATAGSPGWAPTIAAAKAFRRSLSVLMSHSQLPARAPSRMRALPRSASCRASWAPCWRAKPASARAKCPFNARHSQARAASTAKNVRPRNNHARWLTRSEPCCTSARMSRRKSRVPPTTTALCCRYSAPASTRRADSSWPWSASAKACSSSAVIASAEVCVPAFNPAANAGVAKAMASSEAA